VECRACPRSGPHPQRPTRRPGLTSSSQRAASCRGLRFRKSIEGSGPSAPLPWHRGSQPSRRHARLGTSWWARCWQGQSAGDDRLTLNSALRCLESLTNLHAANTLRVAFTVRMNM
jgi:hypothetical protein